MNPQDHYAHLVGKQAINPHQGRQDARMKAKRQRWLFISKIPVYLFDEMARPKFEGMSVGSTYKRPEPKPLNKKYRRWFKKIFGCADPNTIQH